MDGPLYIDEHVLIHESDQDQDFYYLLGPLYSVVGLVDETGTLAYKYAYDAYGRPIETPLPPPAVEGVGSRYLKLTLPDCGDLIAIKVEKEFAIDCPDPTPDIQVRYATTPIAVNMPYPPQDPHNTAWVNSPGPIYLSPLEWSDDAVLYLTGRIFEPGSNYTVSFETADLTVSEEVNVFTTMWGNTNLSADNAVNVFDITTVVDMLKGLDPRLDPDGMPVEAAWDMEATNMSDCQGDIHTDVQDVVGVVDAVKLVGFPCNNPCENPPCPNPCDEGFVGGASPSTGDVHCRNPYFFTGRRLDFNRWTDDFTGPALVLYDYRARPYDAWNGRFLSRDPIGYVDGMNLYEYVKSSPLVHLDPSGQVSLDTWMKWTGRVESVIGGCHSSDTQRLPDYVIRAMVRRAMDVMAKDDQFRNLINLGDRSTEFWEDILKQTETPFHSLSEFYERWERNTGKKWEFGEELVEFLKDDKQIRTRLKKIRLFVDATKVGYGLVNANKLDSKGSVDAFADILSLGEGVVDLAGAGTKLGAKMPGIGAMIKFYKASVDAIGAKLGEITKTQGDNNVRQIAPNTCSCPQQTGPFGTGWVKDARR